MILSNLSTILGKKKLKIADIVKNTSVTRPTLTALYYNTGKGINFDTLNSLCCFLKITPGELISFYDVDISDINIKYTSIEEDSYASDEDPLPIPYVSQANFEGSIEFEQECLGKIGFNGYISCHNPNADFTLTLTWHCSREFYFNIGPDDVLGFIDESLTESIIDNFPGTINDIGSSFYFYTENK